MDIIGIIMRKMHNIQRLVPSLISHILKLRLFFSFLNSLLYNTVCSLIYLINTATVDF